MRKIYNYILIACFILLATTCNAQTITSASDLKSFYTEYLSHFVSDGIKTDSIVKKYCTKEFYKEWNEIVNEKGLYDPFTNGIFDDEDLMKSTLVVRKDSEGYVVSFNYLTWPDNKTKTESVIIYVNTNGKISHTKRPSDGYMIPEQ